MYPNSTYLLALPYPLHPYSAPKRILKKESQAKPKQTNKNKNKINQSPKTKTKNKNPTSSFLFFSRLSITSSFVLVALGVACHIVYTVVQPALLANVHCLWSLVHRHHWILMGTL